MRHLYKGRKLKRTSSHRKALLRNLAASLFDSKRIETTVAKAKELRPFAERLITRAINAVKNETENRVPSGQKLDLHRRRLIARDININRKSSDTTVERTIFDILFEDIAPKIIAEERNGGYTRIIKSGFRRGDGGDTAIIELVDFGSIEDGKASIKQKPKRKTKAKKTPSSKETATEKAKTETVIETFEPEPDIIDEQKNTMTDNVEINDNNLQVEETEETNENVIENNVEENNKVVNDENQILDANSTEDKPTEKEA